MILSTSAQNQIAICCLHWLQISGSPVRPNIQLLNKTVPKTFVCTTKNAVQAPDASLASSEIPAAANQNQCHHLSHRNNYSHRSIAKTVLAARSFLH